MESLKRNWGLVLVAGISFFLGAVILLTVSRVGRQQPVAPTAPTKQQAVEGIPAAQCIMIFDVSVPSPTPSPTPTPTPTPTATPLPTPSETPFPEPSATPTPSPSPSVSPTPSPSASSTPSPTPFARCTTVRAYRVVNSVWEIIQDFSSLHPGDTIIFAVMGSTNTSSTDFDMAQFRITAGGVAGPWQQTTSFNAQTGEFYITYTLLPGISSYAVDAQVHHVTLGWE